MAYATVLCKQIEVPLSGERYEYMLVAPGQWLNDGKPLPDNYSGIVSISRALPFGPDDNKDGDKLTIGPYHFRVIGEDIIGDSYLCVLDRPVNWLTIGWYRTRQVARGVYIRLIVTAWIWGLAERDHNALPSWRDVYILNRLFGRKH